MSSARGFDVIATDYGETLSTTGRPGTAGRPVDQDAAESLRRLHAAGYLLALSSNTPGRSRRPLLRAAGVEDLFCAFVESHQVRAGKPARAFYAALIEAVGCPAERILHVGNRLDGDVLVPYAVGMGAVYVCPYTDPGAHLPAGVLHLRRFAELPDRLTVTRRDPGSPRPSRYGRAVSA